tara:strand:- start:332 stop:514 length:183 start_codon:yes stop_codon:yes gene_type:complete
MKSHRIDYRYREINNAYHNAWNSNFHIIRADSIENAIAQFKRGWRHDLTELEINGEEQAS